MPSVEALEAGDHLAQGVSVKETDAWLGKFENKIRKLAPIMVAILTMMISTSIPNCPTPASS